MKVSQILLFVVALILHSCGYFEYPESNYEEHNKLLVYANQGNDFYLINDTTFEVVDEVTLDVPSEFYSTSMCVSTNNDFLIFVGKYIDDPKEEYYMVKYDISSDSTTGIFSLGLSELGYPKMCAAHLLDESGLIYLYSNNRGTYKIDFFKEKCNIVSYKKDLPKDFYFHSETEWIIRNNYYPNSVYSFSYSELEFFDIGSQLRSYEFVLNKYDTDSIVVKDMVYSNNNDKLYISYLLSQQKAIGESAFFGSYDMSTLKIDTSKVIFPWSANPYYIAYNYKRDECYMIGETDVFYIIGLDSTKYYIKDTIRLVGKTDGPSRIVVNSSKETAFVSCSRSNRVYVVDLEGKQIITTISIIKPYKMNLL